MSAPNTNGTALAKRENGRVVTKEQRDKLKEELSKFNESFAKVLPKFLTPERVVTLALVAATENPKLFQCSRESVALSIMRIAQWGLEIGRTAFLVPFWDSRTKRYVCTPIAHYSGKIEMMMRSGFVRDVTTRAVYSNEFFRVEYGLNETLEHHPIFGEGRGEFIAAYAVARLRGGVPKFVVMSKEEIEKIRKAAQSSDSPAWKGHYDEMGKKTTVHRLAKEVPQTPQLADALSSEDEILALTTGAAPGASASLASGAAPQLMPGREGAMQDRARTVSPDEYGGSETPALSPDAMLAGEDPYAEQDDTWITAQDGELPLGETRRARTAQEEGR